MLLNRLRSNRRICRTDFSAFAASLAALAALVVWAMPARPTQGIIMNLPRTAHSIALWGARREDALQVTIPRDGRIYFGNQQVSTQKLLARIQKRLRAGAPRRLYIRADARVRYRAVISVLDSIHSAGLSDIAVITQPKRRPPQRQKLVGPFDLISNPGNTMP